MFDYNNNDFVSPTEDSETEIEPNNFDSDNIFDMKNIGILDPDGLNLNPLNGMPYSDEYKKFALKWKKYPAYEKAQEIIDALKNNQITLLVCGTGFGKTVLMPKFLLHVFDYKKKIAVTLPKQIIAQSSAQFAALTLDVKLGKEVGYKFKGSDKKSYSDNTKLLFATDGTIVSKLMNDPMLNEYDGILIDEAHERKVQIDFLLYLLRETCKMRPNFKLVIMSATIDEQIFINYFKGFKFVNFNVAGGTHYPIESVFLDKPVQQKFIVQKGLEIIDNLKKTTKDGDILFFVSSVQDTINSCNSIMSNGDSNEYCIEVYSGMNQQKQEMAQELNTSNKRKIIVSTNVAESSLTISNIKYVIDSGYELYGYYDTEQKSKILTKKLITQAQAKQRMGRTGRTGPGVCYHLYTKNDFDYFMEKFPQPTIKVSNIYGECLKLLSLDTIQTIDKLKKVLSNFIEPPPKEYVEYSITTLKKLGLVENENISKMGELITNLQVDPMQGLSIYYGFQLGCVREIIAILSMIDAMKGTINELFNVPKIDEENTNQNNHLVQKFKKAKESLADSSGDHITLLEIFTKYLKLKKNKNKNALNEWLYQHFLKSSVLDKAYKYYNKIKNVVMSKLEKNLVIDHNKHKLKTKIITSLLCGFFINIAYPKNDQQTLSLSNDSFLNKKNTDGKELIYNEMTIINGGNKNMSIGTIITNQIRILFSQIAR
jgi:pre-mRNA-splicing factor ATP-dependent RNA helicase DHX15/PRP43